MQLVELGRLNLDDSLIQFFPGLVCSHSIKNITIRDLLTHTSGLDGSELEWMLREDPGSTRIHVPERLTSYFASGRYFSYGNSGYLLLVGILERLYDDSFPSILFQKVLGPLGVEPVNSNGYPADLYAGVQSRLVFSPESLIKLLHWHVQPLHSHGLLSPNSLRLMQANYVQMPTAYGNADGWGLGWGRFGDGVFGHNSLAEGIITLVRVVPQAGVIVLLQARQGRVLDVASYLLERLFGVVRPEAAINETPIDIEVCRGIYQSHYWQISVENAGHHLAGSGIQWPFRSPKPFQFSMTPVGGSHFLLNIDGKNSGVVSFLREVSEDRPWCLWNGLQVIPRSERV